MDVIAKCRVTCDYEKKDLSELSLKTGDIVDVLKKGKYIWYGRLDDAKGFFPTKVVEEIVDQTPDKKAGNTLSLTAVDDNEKKGTIDGTGETKIYMESKKSDEAFKEIESTSPLEDKRRSRPRSKGRPPSQVFIKENILQRSESMENLSGLSDNEEKEKQQVDTPTVSAKVAAVSQLVMELKQKPNLKSAMQKDTVSSSNTSTEHVNEGPAWMKALPKKKVSMPAAIQKSENSGTIPPWMQEVRKRREHKLSLKGEDDILRKVGQEFGTLQESNVKHAAVEIKSFAQTTTTNHVVTKENSNIQIKSFSMETQEVSSNKSSFTATDTKINQTYSSPDNILDKNSTPAIEEVIENPKEIESSVETQTSNLIPLTKTISNVVATQVINSSNSTSFINTNSSSAEQLKCIKEVKDDSEKIEPTNEAKVSVTVIASTNTTVPSSSKQKLEFITETPEQHESSTAQFTEPKETSECKDKNTEKQNEIILSEQRSPTSDIEKKITNSVGLLLNDIEDFETQYKARMLKIHEDIKKLETSIDQQYQATKILTDGLKVKLSALIETKD